MSKEKELIKSITENNKYAFRLFYRGSQVKEGMLEAASFNEACTKITNSYPIKTSEMWIIKITETRYANTKKLKNKKGIEFI
jgi:hypothetical protein